MNNKTLEFLLIKTNEFAKNLEKNYFFDSTKIIFVEDNLYKSKFCNLKKIQKKINKF